MPIDDSSSLPKQIIATLSNYVSTGNTSLKKDDDGVALLSMRHFPHPICTRKDKPLGAVQKAANAVFLTLSFLLPPFSLAYAAASKLRQVINTNSTKQIEKKTIAPSPKDTFTNTPKQDLEILKEKYEALQPQAIRMSELQELMGNPTREMDNLNSKTPHDQLAMQFNAAKKDLDSLKNPVESQKIQTDLADVKRYFSGAENKDKLLAFGKSQGGAAAITILRSEGVGFYDQKALGNAINLALNFSVDYDDIQFFKSIHAQFQTIYENEFTTKTDISGPSKVNTSKLAELENFIPDGVMAAALLKRIVSGKLKAEDLASADFKYLDVITTFLKAYEKKEAIQELHSRAEADGEAFLGSEEFPLFRSNKLLLLMQLDDVTVNTVNDGNVLLAVAELETYFSRKEQFPQTIQEAAKDLKSQRLELYKQQLNVELDGLGAEIERILSGKESEENPDQRGLFSHGDYKDPFGALERGEVEQYPIGAAAKQALDKEFHNLSITSLLLEFYNAVNPEEQYKFVVQAGTKSAELAPFKEQLRVLSSAASGKAVSEEKIREAGIAIYQFVTNLRTAPIVPEKFDSNESTSLHTEHQAEAAPLAEVDRKAIRDKKFAEETEQHQGVFRGVVSEAFINSAAVVPIHQNLRGADARIRELFKVDDMYIAKKILAPDEEVVFVQDEKAWNGQNGFSFSFNTKTQEIRMNNEPISKLTRQHTHWANKYLNPEKLKNHSLVGMEKIKESSPALGKPANQIENEDNKSALKPDDFCFFIQNQSDGKDIVGRKRNETENKILAATSAIQGNNVPYITIDIDNQRFHLLKINTTIEHSNSNFYLRVNDATNEKNIIQNSLRRQTSEDTVALNAKLKGYEEAGTVEQKMVVFSNDETCKIIRHIPISDFKVDHLLSPAPVLNNDSKFEPKLSFEPLVIVASEIAVVSPKIPLSNDDRCVMIQGTDPVTQNNISKRHRNQNEEAIYQAVKSLNKEHPFVSVKIGDETFHYAKLVHKPLVSASRFYVQVNGNTGEKKVVELSLRNQTGVGKYMKMNEYEEAKVVQVGSSESGQDSIKVMVEYNKFTLDRLLRSYPRKVL